MALTAFSALARSEPTLAAHAERGSSQHITANILSMALVLAGVSAQVDDACLQASTASFLASSLLVAHTTLAEFSWLGAIAAQRSWAATVPHRKLPATRAATTTAERMTPRADILSPIAGLAGA